MKYAIEKDKLNKVFATYIERIFDDIRIDEENDLVDGNVNDGTYLGGVVLRDGKYIFSVPNWSRLIRPLSNTFGDMWEELLLDYVRSKLPDYTISKFVLNR